MPLKPTPATQHEHDAGDSRDSGLPPARNRRGPEFGAAADVLEHDVRSRRSGEKPAPDEAGRIQPPIDHAPPVRPRVESALPIRPVLPPRAAMPAREAAAFEPPAPVPDVHIHIGRIELTAVTAPAPRRERAAAPYTPMPLDEYLRRRHGGAR